MVKITIDDKPVEVEVGITILKAAENAGVAIPHFCYHPAFAPEGSCRMCLVEIEGLPKLELACSTQVRDGMKVFTMSEKVVEARRGVLEFLLAGHPLDCPICDKAGDCKLQDYFDEYGLFEGRFFEEKEKAQKKNEIGKSLIHDQERCILCRRCVRFLSEVTKTNELGVFERGVHSEISIYENIPVDNNYSGNLAQICPVGAITDKDFRFKTRSWFLEKRDSICPLCNRGCSITIESHRGFARFKTAKRVYRVCARKNPEVNGFWICDLGRYGYNYLDKNRLGKSLFSDGYPESGWTSGMEFLNKQLKKLQYKNKPNRMVLILNSWLSNEDLFMIKKVFLDDLQVKRIYFVDPPEGKEDGFLMTAERSPNRRGAKELGFELSPLNLEETGKNTDLLICFGTFVSAHWGYSELQAALKPVKTKVLFSAHDDEITGLFDLVLPVSLIAEKGGSLINIDGKVQKFSPALEAFGESRAEWSICADLGLGLGINFKYFKKIASPEDVFQAMAEEIPYFGKNSD